MSVKHPIEVDIALAEAATQHAKSVRTFHARRTQRGSEQREEDISVACERIAQAMKPLRSHLGQAPYRTQSDYLTDLTERVREASAGLQSERRKLWKMRARKSKRSDAD